MDWNRSETLALAMHQCTQCHGSGLRLTKKGSNSLQLRFTGDFSHLLGSVRALRHAGTALEPRFAGAARRPFAPIDVGKKRRGIYRGFFISGSAGARRFRVSPVPIPLHPGRRLEIVHQEIKNGPGQFLPRCLSH